MPEGSGPAGSEPTDSTSGEQLKPLATRRDFLVGAGAGAVAVGVVAGAGVAVTRTQTVTQPGPAVQTAPSGPAVVVPAPPQQVQPAPQAPAPQQAPAQAQLPASMRRVSLLIDGVKHDVTVDVRESLWETMTRGLGMASSNLGCDRAQCGACSVVVDGRAANSCSILSARLGRGQQILTVAGLARGTGVAGLHPIQRAFWEDGGFQCGICTRGFIMSTYALLQANPNPTDDEIAEALSGNVCRCGEYVKIFTAVRTAAAEMRGEQITHLAPSSVFPSSQLRQHRRLPLVRRSRAPRSSSNSQPRSPRSRSSSHGLGRSSRRTEFSKSPVVSAPSRSSGIRPRSTRPWPADAWRPRVKHLFALLAIVFLALNALVGFLFVREALTDKMAHKGFILQSLPLLGGAALILFCLPLLWQAVRLLTVRPAAT